MTYHGGSGIKAKIWWDVPSAAYIVSIPYNESFLNALKQLIPGGDRSYDPNTKFWYIKETYGEFVRKLASDAFGIHNVSFVSKTVAEQSASQSTSSNRSNPAAAKLGGGTTEDVIVAFMNLVPYEAARKCYQQTALAYHPDHNPQDGDKMVLLNQLWDRLVKELYKR